jgi:flagellar basal body rod protein FlgG
VPEDDMPIHGIVNTARSLGYWLRSQEVTANNLANANSDAFKVDRITARQLDGAPFPQAVMHTDLRQGTLRETGRPLDLALDGDGFLVVQTDRGERLVRGGSLQLDPSGQLTDSHGAPVLGEKGPILAAGGTIEVHGDGSVMVDGALVGRLRMVQVPGQQLQKEGSGRFQALAPMQPVTDGAVRVKQGRIEEPNVDPLLGMVDLVAIQRAYAANLDALHAMDGVLGTVVNQVGRVE